jgi:hypothetical protein
LITGVYPFGEFDLKSVVFSGVLGAVSAGLVSFGIDVVSVFYSVLVFDG